MQVRGPEDTVRQVAQSNRMSPQQVYQAMLPAGGTRGGGLPASPPAGTGSRTLADLCAAHGLNLPDTLRGLAQQGVKAAAGMTLKEAAAANGMSPQDFYEALRRVAAGG